MKYFKKSIKEKPEGADAQEFEDSSSKTVQAPAEVSKCTAENKELEELLLMLQLMEMECIQDQLASEKEILKDDFKMLERIMNKCLFECKELIQSRYQAQLKKGNSVEVIEKGVLVTQKLNELDANFERLRDIYKKQLKQRGKKFTDEELDNRFEELQSFKQQIEEARKLFKSTGPSQKAQDDFVTLKDFKAKQNRQSTPYRAAAEIRDANEEEQAVIDRWKARDTEMDRQVLEIGDAIDHLRDVAIQIEEKAEQQSRSLKHLHRHAEEAQAELSQINLRLREILKTQNYGNWICKLVLTLILVGLIGYIISIVNNRIIRSK